MLRDRIEFIMKAVGSGDWGLRDEAGAREQGAGNRGKNSKLQTPNS